MNKLKEIVKLGQMELNAQLKEIQRERHELKMLFWETTLRCNAKCKHCGSRAGEGQYEDELTTDEIKKAFEQIATDFDPRLMWVYVTGGEPLVRKDLSEVMEYATGLGFHWGMTTNGMLFNDQNINDLRRAKLEAVSISIDGLEKTHDTFRGVEGSYNKIIGNIKKLQKANYLQSLQVTTVFSKHNIDEIDELYKMLLDLGVKRWRLMPVDPIGRTTDDMLLDGLETKKILDFIIKHKKDRRISLEYGCPSFLGLEYEKEVRNFFFYCRTGISVASILYNGDLFVCPNVPRRPELIQGNIRRDNFKDIWDNKYKEFRDRDRCKCEMCDNCDFFNVCLGGAYHTWDFENKVQKRCVYEMIKNI